MQVYSPPKGLSASIIALLVVGAALASGSLESPLPSKGDHAVNADPSRGGAIAYCDLPDLPLGRAFSFYLDGAVQNTLTIPAGGDSLAITRIENADGYGTRLVIDGVSVYDGSHYHHNFFPPLVVRAGSTVFVDRGRPTTLPPPSPRSSDKGAQARSWASDSSSDPQHGRQRALRADLSSVLKGAGRPSCPSLCAQTRSVIPADGPRAER